MSRLSPRVNGTNITRIFVLSWSITRQVREETAADGACSETGLSLSLDESNHQKQLKNSTSGGKKCAIILLGKCAIVIYPRI